MDSNSLKEIRNNLSALPVLEGRLERLQQQVDLAEETVATLKRKWEAESKDVDQLMGESFTVSLLRLIGKYEGKLSKESQEELLAKMEYDKACSRVDQLRTERDDISGRIALLQGDRQKYLAELNRRKNEIERNVDTKTYAQFSEMEGQIDSLAKQITELDEALRAASRVMETSKTALEELESAQSWATYDVWARGGLLSHLEKYDRIDQAQSSLSDIESQLKDLKRELSDVNLQDSVNFTHIDSMTRTVDFWFDNIFTDLNVRSIIQDNHEQLSELCVKINGITATMQRNKTELHQKIDQLEKSMEDLLVG